ncbi:MAG: glycolate oxidase subunit GlcE [Pseudomonadota bacterium]
MRPVSEAELSDAVRDARGALRLQGGGTRAGLGHGVKGEVLETGGLSGIRLYEPGALTLVAGAGTPLAEIEAALDEAGQRLAFEPMDHRALYRSNGAPTIGGVVAANVSGPRRVQVGACRDHLLGVRFVDGHGTVLQNGGRVMKNVTGYDLVKLMAGSHGTLGVLSEVSLKVVPAAETEATLVLDGLSDAEAIDALSAALGTPFEVSGAAHLSGGATWLRVEGFPAQVTYRASALEDLLADRASVRVLEDRDESAALWAGIRDARAIAEGDGDVWRISVRPSDGARARAAVGEGPALFDWGGGLIWLRVAAGTDVRSALNGIAGHATLVRAAEETKAAQGAFHPEPAPVQRLSAGLRQRFDPRGILNPGRMG